MGHTQLKRYLQQLISWSYTHIMVSYCSILILSCWGLGISPLTIVGNTVFSPVLSLFLLLATIIFLLELIGIPSGYLLWVLEQVTAGWLWCMQAAQPYFYSISFVQPTTMQLIIMGLATLCILLTRAYTSTKLMLLCVLISYSLQYGYHQPDEHGLLQLPCNNGQVTVHYCNGSMWVIDTGCMGRTSGAATFLQYQLLPAMVKRFGSNRISHYIMLQPGTLSCDALAKTIAVMPIDHLYIPNWQGDDPKLARAYISLKKACAQTGTTLHRSITSPISSDDSCIQLTHLPHSFKKGTINLPRWLVELTHDDETVTLQALAAEPKGAPAPILANNCA